MTVQQILRYDPVPWLMKQEGLEALRARRMVGLGRDGDDREVRAVERRFARSQRADGSFESSFMKTAAVLNLLLDLKANRSDTLIEAGVQCLLSVLESQPGYERARDLKPGSLTRQFDLCGFFGPQDDRLKAETLARNTREVNFWRRLAFVVDSGRKPLRGVRRGSFDRPGPGTCYTWGLIPLSRLIETIGRAGHADEERLQPAVNALLAAQRENGGWCGCGVGQVSCTLRAVGALQAHPELRRSGAARRAVDFLRRSSPWHYVHAFMLPTAAGRFGLPITREIIREALTQLAPRQQKNGTFGAHQCRIERVAAVLYGLRALGQ